jgi:hypothetical protein
MTKRRSRGEGSIFQNPRGFWVGQITLPNGSRKVKTSKTQKVVQDRLIKQRKLLQDGLARLSTMYVLEERLPKVRKSRFTSSLAIGATLSSKYGKPLPWRMLRDALAGAFQAHYLERTIDSKYWPCDYGDAQWIKVRVPKDVLPPPPPPTPEGEWVVEADLQPSQIQDLAEGMGDLPKVAARSEIKFHLRVELDKDAKAETISKLNEALKQIDKQLMLEKPRSVLRIHEVS